MTHIVQDEQCSNSYFVSNFALDIICEDVCDHVVAKTVAYDTKPLPWRHQLA